MFRIKLAIKEDDVLTGLDALDERRRLGLPDDTYLMFSAVYTATVKVPEEFARKYFDRFSTEMCCEIPIASLVSSDVGMSAHERLAILETILPERAMELFAAHYVTEDVSCSG